MRKMNGDLMYKRIKAYADVCFGGGTVEDWKYEVTEDQKESFWGLVRVAKLTQTIVTENGYTFDMVSIILIPFDGRKSVHLDTVLD